MKLTTTCLVVLLSLAGCGGSEQESKKPAASPVAIDEGCEIVKAHWGRDSDGVDEVAFRELYDDLSAVTNKMNSADASALRPFAIAALNVTEAAEGADYGNAYASYLETFKDAADACEAAGSPVV